MENSWAQNSKGRYGGLWALGASLSFHALLILLLTTTSSIDLTIGRETRFDLFWLTPSSAPTESPAATAAVVQSAPAFVPDSATGPSAPLPSPQAAGGDNGETAPPAAEPTADQRSVVFTIIEAGAREEAAKEAPGTAGKGVRSAAPKTTPETATKRPAQPRAITALVRTVEEPPAPAEGAHSTAAMKQAPAAPTKLLAQPKQPAAIAKPENEPSAPTIGSPSSAPKAAAVTPAKVTTRMKTPTAPANPWETPQPAAMGSHANASKAVPTTPAKPTAQPKPTTKPVEEPPAAAKASLTTASTKPAPAALVKRPAQPASATPVAKPGNEPLNIAMKAQTAPEVGKKQERTTLVKSVPQLFVPLSRPVTKAEEQAKTRNAAADKVQAASKVEPAPAFPSLPAASQPQGAQWKPRQEPRPAVQPASKAAPLKAMAKKLAPPAGDFAPAAKPIPTASSSQATAGKGTTNSKSSPAMRRQEAPPSGKNVVLVANNPEARSLAGNTKPPIRQKPAEKLPEERGLVFASLQGDLKMVITGDSNIKLSVTFKPYPKGRRRTPLTHAESRREQQILPLLGKRGQSREGVIETAREGIYTFSAESETGRPAKANFTLKIFEAGAGERVVKLGTRTVTGKAVLAKVMMPDGILWDDDSAFTGSLEDAGSTTKFNAETGLYWKEYNN